NNVAMAAAHAIDALGLSRVLIIDWDVHHGNGTQDIFFDRDDVLFMSVHQSPLYPGTGAAGEVGVGRGEGHTVNLPLPAGSNDADYYAAFERLLLPIARQYQPEVVLVSAGFDAHCDDPLGGMNVSSLGFGALCAMVARFAAEFCEGRMALVLEGGYDLAGLSGSALACARVLAGTAADAWDSSVSVRSKTQGPGQATTEATRAIEAAAAVQRRYWRL
ncbi:MAG: histone deacetylase, partial [Myxococcales bacterium]|nr:histone deacetylase [Myxococcales bacterium]